VIPNTSSIIRFVNAVCPKLLSRAKTAWFRPSETAQQVIVSSCVQCQRQCECSQRRTRLGGEDDEELRHRCLVVVAQIEGVLSLRSEWVEEIRYAEPTAEQRERLLAALLELLHGYLMMIMMR
jgi:hypothetical protein